MLKKLDSIYVVDFKIGRKSVYEKILFFYKAMNFCKLVFNKKPRHTYIYVLALQRDVGFLDDIFKIKSL